ncbi:hypothetical protein LJR118_006284 [Acidovorax sp. LjRoot118]|uniref:hypothetical protein n=1 Tax=Acidovorax sp. LjRoot118 TaxID=3342256 RepID=UPI003ECEA306
MTHVVPVAEPLPAVTVSHPLAFPTVAACARILVLLPVFFLHRCSTTPWVAGRAALHNAGSTRLESP